MTISSSNRIVAAISDSVSCIGLANWLAIPRSASTRQISFRINRVAISIIATYSNNSISRNEAAGTIQFIKMHVSNEAWHWTSQCHALDSGSGGEITYRGRDRVEPGRQRSCERSITGTVKHGKYNDADNSPDDHVLERHHAVLVRAQTLQRSGALDVMLQHSRNFSSC